MTRLDEIEARLDKVRDGQKWMYAEAADLRYLLAEARKVEPLREALANCRDNGSWTQPNIDYINAVLADTEAKP